VLPGVKDYLQQKGISIEKIILLPNSANLQNTLYSKYSVSDQITIIYAGSFNVANDLDTLLQAVKILQQHHSEKFKVQLIGEGPEKNRLIQWAQLHQLKIVEFLPPVPKTEIYQILSNADIFVGMVKNSNLYRWGTSLNKISDYLACGRPIIFALNSPYD